MTQEQPPAKKDNISFEKTKIKQEAKVSMLWAHCRIPQECEKMKTDLKCTGKEDL